MPSRLLLLLVLVAAGFQAGESATERGDALRKRFRYDDAIAAYNEALAAGDMRALARLAGMRGAGQGMPEDKARAAEEMRRAAEAGIPEAMEAMSKIVWPMDVVACLKRADLCKESPDAPDPPEALAALEWRRRAALAWIAADQPFAAWRIACDLDRDNPFNPLHGLKATPQVVTALRAAVTALPLDRAAVLAGLFALPAGDPRALDAVRKLLLPPAPALLTTYDDERLQLVGLLGRPGSQSAILASGGGGARCGTGRGAGGITVPTFPAQAQVRIAIACDPAGSVTFTYRSGREQAFVMDADGDGTAAELVICDGGRDYDRPPFVLIRDLLAPGCPAMVALEFNAHAGVDRLETVTELIPVRRADGSEELEESTVMRSICEEPIPGSWRLAPGASGRNEIELSWKDGSAPVTLRIPFDPALRRWLPPDAPRGRFWRERQ